MSLIKKSIHLNSIGDPPRVKCGLCEVEHKPVVLNLTSVEWLQAAHQMGWRQVETRNILFEMLCRDCILDLEKITSIEN
ncbi:hypothetical protein [Aliikangiella maris]|uniref:Uncharacterized protein n=2 Tax=Aliikangiella maris TaxID=3162458 RepID=A0ABV2BPW8_9GAMM